MCNVETSFSYNVINGLLETVNYTNGMVCSYGFDDIDRLTSLTWRGASNNVLRSRSYSYTLAGMISRVDMESGEKVDCSYDSLDRLTAEKRTDPYGQIIAWDIYEYDLTGNRTKKTIFDASGSTLLTVNYALATGNRLASWSVPETNLVAKFPVVGVASESIGTNDQFGYLWVSNATAGGMAVKPEVDGTNFWTYDFTVGMGTQKIVAAIRDAAGNMGYATNTIIPTVITNGAYQYSAAGCLTNIAYKGKDTAKTLGLTWDGQYQLTAVATNGGVVESYKYDAFGRRVMTAAAGMTNWYVYDGPHVIADLNSTGGVVRSYVWGPGIDNLLALTVYGGTTNTYYALKDHLNSVLALTDSSGQIVEQYRYDAWGRTTVFDGNGSPLTVSAVGNRYLWQGREYSWKIHAANNGNGLYYFRARWYDPVTGRWLSNDPIGISGGLNQYVFCANNPVNFTDAFGLASGNPISGGGTDIYYPNGGWGSVNAPGASFEHRTTSGFANAYRVSEPALVSFGAGAVVAGGIAGVAAWPVVAPYVYLYGGSAAVILQNVPYTRVGSAWLAAEPYIGQFMAGVIPGPPNLITTIGYWPLLETFLYGAGNMLSPFGGPLFDLIQSGVQGSRAPCQ